MPRRPFALANWKMAMTLGETWRFFPAFVEAAGDALRRVDVVICPPCTALSAAAGMLAGAPVALGVQDVAAEEDEAHTGRISAALAADAGATWALLGHWELRRERGDIDITVNRKLRRALAAGLRAIVSVGEGRLERGHASAALARQLPALLAGCTAKQVAGLVFMYEPEWTIGAAEPASSDYVAAGCGLVRTWLRETYGDSAAETVRVFYGGSVRPEAAADLLASPDVDGLGAGRRGRDPQAFAAIVRHIAAAKSAGGI